ncbi:putative oocyte-secreted protein 1 homolog, partial [Trichechus manatus latirostris]|uniref:Oocyte-secreted protein 1 homolog n=1 Tax=Trichechus manatus latirostris TaxID=127582 RepID=A0A2Y9RZK2_TRIMA
MKAFLGFRGLFLLSLMWTCAGDWSAVQVQCSYFWFYAKIKPTIFHNIYMAPDEAFLGDYCAVTRFEPDVFYEFFYHSYDCGIITKILQETLLLKTKIKYISKISNNQAEMPLSCVVHHHNPFFNDVEIRDSDTDSDNGWDIQVKIQAESTGQGGDMVVTSAVCPWQAMFLPSPA